MQKSNLTPHTNNENNHIKVRLSKKLLSFLVIFIILNIISATLIYVLEQIDISKNKKPLTEVQKILTTTNLKLQEKSYRTLIERVGPLNAQDELYRSGIPFDGQSHLLNHTVGNWIYNKYGTIGITYCKDYFLSSCYHGFVIKAISENGLEVLDKIMNPCYKKGQTTSAQCAHGVGHGLLAWLGYANLPQALKECDKLQLTNKDFPVYNCHDGVFMENVWAIHENGKPSPDRWSKTTDPQHPCNAVDPIYQKACWSNQPQLIHQLITRDFKKIAIECDKLTDEDLKWTCYDSIARHIHPATKGNVDETFRLCSEMPGKWSEECLLSNVSASYSTGDRTLPFQICEQTQLGQKNSCYNRLLNMIMTYHSSEQDRINMCQKIPIPYWKRTCITDAK